MAAPSPIRTALVSGASIAGPALAHWLARAGVDVTVVERAPELREGGHNIDVRGAGREVLRRMGLEREVLPHTTGEAGTRFIADRGRVLGTFPASTSKTGGPTAEVEVLRGRLSRLLVDSCSGHPGEVDWRFDEQISDVDDDLPDRAEGATVAFASGRQERYDVVVVAEGLRSRTRQKVFGGGPGGGSTRVKELGAYCAYLAVPRESTDNDY